MIVVVVGGGGGGIANGVVVGRDGLGGTGFVFVVVVVVAAVVVVINRSLCANLNVKVIWLLDEMKGLRAVGKSKPESQIVVLLN